MTRKEILNHYLSIFSTSAKLYQSMGDFGKEQGNELKEIYKYSFIGLLREGYAREFFEKDGESFILIKVEDVPYAMKSSILQKILGEEYDGIINKAGSLQNSSPSPQDLPEYYEEGREKKAEDFVYAQYHAEIVSKEDGSVEETDFSVYPERIPRGPEDKIKTIVTVKGKRNAISLGDIGTTTRFKIGRCEFGAKCDIDKNTGNLKCKIVKLAGTSDYEINITNVKDFDVKTGTKRNSHMIVMIQGKEVHVFPMDYNNNDMKGCAETVALVGEERVALVPAGANILPVTQDDNSRVNVKFFWKNDSLHYSI